MDSEFLVIPDNPSEKIPMHPEDYAGLLAWVRAKEVERNPRGSSD